MNATAKIGHRRQGFTLVELLVVITVIGIIAGLAIPAVMGALKTARVAGMQAELESFNQGIEAYKNKYGDFPPDFSSWDVVRRHYLKIFPDIDQAELLLLYRLCDIVADNDTANQTNGSFDDQYLGSVMDRGEALVWSLGGFSSDPQHPFTGTGGPLVAMVATPGANPANYQYNPERDNRLVEFDASRLSIVPFNPAAGVLSYTNRTRSGDEPPASFGLTATPFLADLFPTYVLYEDASPVVYFDARTYGFVDPAVSAVAFNGFGRFVDNATDVDGVRPLFSTTPSSTLPAGPYGTLAASVAAWKFMNPQTFQLLAPGLDRRFGAVIDVDGGVDDKAPVYFQYPTGALIRADAMATNPQGLFVANVQRYDLTAAPFNQRENFVSDNMSNFSSKTFGDELP